MGYEKQQWLDHIYKIDPTGKPIPKRDTSGQIIYNPYTGYPEWQAFEEGSRFTAPRMNHIEEGIATAHSGLFELDKAYKKMLAQLEIDGRVPNHSGSFVDAFDGTAARLTRLTAQTEVTATVTSATKNIPVASTTGFTAMTFATIYDANSYEHVLITAIGANTITVQALTSTYSKGAKIARSTATINTTNQTLDVAPFVTHSVELVEVV